MEKQLKAQLQSKDSKQRAQAIKSLALSGERENIQVLKEIHENDPDSQIQEYARKAALHLHTTLSSADPEKTSPSPSKSDQTVPKERESSPKKSTIESRKKQASRSDIQAAERQVQRAFSLHTRGQTKKALQVFIRALKLNPGLGKDQFVKNLAAELTGLPFEEALQSLGDRTDQKELLDSVQESTKKPARKKSPISLILLLVALTALAVVSSRFLSSGMFDRYRVLVAQKLGGFNQHQAGGKSYHLMKPLGKAPEEGWPVVVGFHGYGGQGADMLGITSIFTKEGIVYIAPTFGGYEPYPGIGPIEPMRQILEDVSSQIPIDKGRVVLLGFSQGGTFAYRFSVYHPEWVSGVVTAGAPDLDAGTPTRGNIPYIFTWGELDGLQNMVLPASVYPLINQGYNVRYKVIPGAGHEVTPYAIDRVLALVGQ
jgi:predicted esterase